MLLFGWPLSEHVSIQKCFSEGAAGGYPVLKAITRISDIKRQLGVVNGALSVADRKNLVPPQHRKMTVNTTQIVLQDAPFLGSFRLGSQI
jgi:hypothetical protein